MKWILCKDWWELILTGMIWGGCMLMWPHHLLIWLLAIPGAMVWWVVARFVAWQLVKRTTNWLEGE